MPTSSGIVIGKADTNEALDIAQSLPEFFSADGLVALTHDLKVHELRGAFISGRLAGFIMLRKADVASLEISWLAVRKDLQGQGIGSALVKSSLQEFFEKGFRMCYVKTLAETVEDKGYERTRKFYKDLGFSTLEIIDPYPGWSAGNPCQILAASLPLE